MILLAWAGVRLVLAIASGGQATAAILAVNDVYRIEGLTASETGGLARLRALRAQLEIDHPDLIVLHAGDFLAPSLMSRRYEGRQMVDVMNRLDGDPEAFDPRLVATFGNHEFDFDADALRARLLESRFWWLGSDLELDERVLGGVPIDSLGSGSGIPLRGELIVESGGVSIGIFSLTLVDKEVDYLRFPESEAVAPPTVFGTKEGQALKLRRQHRAAREATRRLRSGGAEVVVALTHLPMAQDSALLAHLRPPGGPDLVIGGHDHDRRQVTVDGRPILKADSDARSATWVRLTKDRPSGRLRIEHELIELNRTPDPVLTGHIEDWIVRHGRAFCGPHGLEPDCLFDTLAVTGGEWRGEELAIRAGETGLGNWIADQMLAEARREGFDADVAIVNSGGLRLNQDLPAGSAIERRHLEELIEYRTQMRVLTLPVRTLAEAFEHSARCDGTGAWLQFGGATIHVSEGTRRLESLTIGGVAPTADDSVAVVVPEFLIGNDAEGYGMLEPGYESGALPRDLKDVLYAALDGAPGGVVEDAFDPSNPRVIEVPGTGSPPEACPVT